MLTRAIRHRPGREESGDIGEENAEPGTEDRCETLSGRLIPAGDDLRGALDDQTGRRFGEQAEADDSSDAEPRFAHAIVSHAPGRRAND